MPPRTVLPLQTEETHHERHDIEDHPGMGSVRVEPGAKRIRAYLSGELVAYTSHPLLVWQRSYHPTCYFPATDVRTDLLSPDGNVTHSPSCGDGHSFSVRGGKETAGAALRSRTGLSQLIRPGPPRLLFGRLRQPHPCRPPHRRPRLALNRVRRGVGGADGSQATRCRCLSGVARTRSRRAGCLRASLVESWPFAVQRDVRRTSCGLHRSVR